MRESEGLGEGVKLDLTAQCTGGQRKDAGEEKSRE